MIDSSVKFNMDKKAQQMKYANSASGGQTGPNDMVYNVKADRVDTLKQANWVQASDASDKTHLTQMKTLNSFGGNDDNTPTSPART